MKVDQSRARPEGYRYHRGAVYRHFKGTFYVVVSLAKHSETDEALVIYQKLDGDPLHPRVWARPQTMFEEKVDGRPRFQLVCSTCKGKGTVSFWDGRDGEGRELCRGCQVR